MPGTRTLLLLLALAAMQPPALADEHPIAIIMARNTAHRTLTPLDLKLIYKRKKSLWDDGTRIQPINLPVAHPLRQAFSLELFGRTPEEQEEYWRDQYFHGVLPPYVLASEEAVIRFVASTPGAIGYISRCLADRRVMVVMQFDEGGACPK